MKYDGVDVAAGGAETSHAIVAELVGSGRRVLDVGCSTGYLAQVLVQAGNRVSGVELDPEAAEKARPLLDQLVVGDLDEMDLSESFPPKSFDVVVFADVLEHLKDPVRTLSQAAPLLDEEGFAVLSIPNVAHAAVRLSLLQGRFDYSPVGLLDDTHLRFFTRSALHDLLDQAGFVATDVRRTTAPPFGTEIPLDPRDFPEEVVGLVSEDPDSTTYQFVLAARPARGVDASYRREMSRLAEQLSQVAAALRRVPPQPTVGVCAGSSPLEGIRRTVVAAELRRRLDGFAVRAYTADPAAGVSDLTGEALFPLGGGQALAGEVDAVVLAGGAPPPEVGEGPAADTSKWEVDPLVLAGRVLDLQALERRARFVAISDPDRRPEPTILTDLAGDDEGLATLARRRKARLRRPPDGGGDLDLAAAVHAAEVVVAADPALAALACGLGRPLVVVDAGPETAFAMRAAAGGLAVGPREALAALGEDLEGRPSGAAREAMWAEADAAFDELASRLLAAGGRRAGTPPATRVAELARRVEVLETVNAGLRARLEALLGRPEDARPASTPAVASGKMTAGLRETLSATEQHVQHLQEEIDRIYSTRLMRTVQPLRRVYARVRRS